MFQEQFQDKTPYTIMFGPDKCGEDYKVFVCLCIQSEPCFENLY